MVTSTYALRESTSKANSLKNRGGSSNISYNPSDFYTEKDPQYYLQAVHEKKMPRSKTKSVSSKKGRKSNNNKTRNISSSTTFLYDEVKRIRHPEINDVLCGRGGNINKHPGNIAFRSYVSVHKNEYNLSTNKNIKALISQSIVDTIHNLDPPGRFLIKDESTHGGEWWIEVDNNKAMAKTSQALREGAPSIRAMAVDSVSSKPDKTSLKSVGKRKRARSKIYGKVAEDENDDEKSNYQGDEFEKPNVEDLSHPIIIPMGDGHRGKQLVPRTDIEEVGDDGQPFDEDSNSFLTFDINFHSEESQNNNYNENYRMSLVDANAATPPPASHSNSEQVPSLTLSAQSKDLDNWTFSDPVRTLPLGSPGGRTTMPSFDIHQQSQNGFKRAHSLASSEINGYSDTFRGDEKFVNPFLNDSREFNDNCNKEDKNHKVLNGSGNWNPRNNVDRTFTRKDSSSHCSLWSVRSDFQLCQDDIEDNFFDEVRNINILSHPDITTPLSGQDNIPTHLIPYEKKGIQISPIKKRFSLNRDRLPLPRKSSSSSSSIKVEMVHNQ